MTATIEKFVVRQRVSTAIGNMIIDVHEGNHFREADMFYESCLKNRAGEYFEFCKIETTETCINFTKGN